MRVLAFLLATSFAMPAAALELGLPIACKPGEDCWIVRYVDHDPGSGFADYMCGGLGSDAHSGTDFAITDPRRMREGVEVLAAAAGTVRGVRDGMPDQPPNGRMTHDYGQRNCGNAVVIRHEDGWETQYCHFREGSVAVREGDKVEAGQKLGLVGMSGEANFPHVHLAVRLEGKTVDPFTGTRLDEPCSQRGSHLWHSALEKQLAYIETPIALVGLTDRLVSRDDIVAGIAAATHLRTDSAALVGYYLVYGLRKDDRLHLRIERPDGSELINHTVPITEDAPRSASAAGRKAPPGGWQSGNYMVEVIVERGEKQLSRQETFTITQ